MSITKREFMSNVVDDFIASLVNEGATACDISAACECRFGRRHYDAAVDAVSRRKSNEIMQSHFEAVLLEPPQKVWR